MLNILLPMADQSMFFREADWIYPKPLIDVEGAMLVERVLAQYAGIADKRFLFVIRAEDAQKHSLDRVLRLLTESCLLHEVRGETRGALCSALLHVGAIDNDTPLLVANADQIVDVDYEAFLAGVAARNLDAATLVFPSAHPRWSYVQLDGQDEVQETAEKRPISRDAIAGLYYFRRGSDFVTAAKRAIEKEAMVAGRYFLSACFNELILMQRRVGASRIDAAQYHSFYAPDQIERYQRLLAARTARAA